MNQRLETGGHRVNRRLETESSIPFRICSYQKFESLVQITERLEYCGYPHIKFNIIYIMRSSLWRYQARVSRISICKIPHLDSSAAFLSIPAQSMSVHADATRFSCSCASRDTDVDAHAASCQAASDFQCTGIRSGFANHSSRRSGSESLMRVLKPPPDHAARVRRHPFHCSRLRLASRQ